jgi:hypothetical protein
MTERIRYAASLERQSRDYAEGVEAQYAINRQRAEKDGFMIPDDPMFRFTENHVRGQAINRKQWERLVKAVESGDAPFERVYVKARPRTGRWKDPREQFTGSSGSRSTVFRSSTAIRSGTSTCARG